MRSNEVSGSALAYLGDAIWSLKVREYLIEKGYARAKDLQTKSVKFVSAKAQAAFYYKLEEEKFFTEQELEIFKRGRNFKSDSVPKNTDVATYRVSTGFEAVLGYWFMEKMMDRIDLCWDKVKTMVEV